MIILKTIVMMTITIKNNCGNSNNNNDKKCNSKYKE